MTHWLDAVSDPKAVQAVFGDDLPSLDQVTVETLNLAIIGRGVVLGVELADYPAVPPAKWARQGYDTVWLSLAFDDAEVVDVRGPLTPARADITVERDGEQIVANLVAADFTMSVRCRWLNVRKVTAGKRTSQS